MTATFLLRRLFYGILSLAILSAIVFFCTQLLPGDAASVMLGENATPEALAALRQRLGLDRAAPVQLVLWMAGILHGDLGLSATLGQPVAALIGPPFLA